MIVALIDSGLGLLPTAAWLRKLRPEIDLLLLLDPDGVPWGPKPQAWVVDRVVNAARNAVRHGAAAVVLPCNTASVTALDRVRAELGESVPVIGTVPAVKPAAAQCASFAIWATATTTASRYQADLIARFGDGAEVTGVACHGLVDAIEAADMAAVEAAVADAAARTPANVQGVVLGCTHYPLVEHTIAAALPRGTQLFDSAEAVAVQTLRRIAPLDLADPGTGDVRVLNSGREGELPSAAAAFEAGRFLGALVDTQ